VCATGPNPNPNPNPNRKPNPNPNPLTVNLTLTLALALALTIALTLALTLTLTRGVLLALRHGTDLSAGASPPPPPFQRGLRRRMAHLPLEPGQQGRGRRHGHGGYGADWSVMPVLLCWEKILNKKVEKVEKVERLKG
jgi:hypothetical protein